MLRICLKRTYHVYIAAMCYIVAICEQFIFEWLFGRQREWRFRVFGFSIVYVALRWTCLVYILVNFSQCTM